MEIKIKTVFSDFSTVEKRKALLNRINVQLKKQAVILKESDSNDFQALLILTGGTEKQAVDLINKHPNIPAKTLLLTHNGYNSLPAALEISAFLHNEGFSAEIINLESPAAGNKLKAALSPAKPLCDVRIGVIGKPSDWLIASSQSADIVKNTWGIELISVSISSLIENIEVCAQDVPWAMADLHKIHKVEPRMKDIKNSEDVYDALRDIIAQNDFQGITVRCFDLVNDLKMTACYALAQLNAENFPAGCEGDIASIVGMLWAKKQTGLIPWMANPARIDQQNSTLVLAHCTAPFNYLKNIVYRSHFESGLGVGIQGYLDFKKVTIFRLGGKNLDKIWISEGKLLRHLNESDLCRTQIEIQLPASDLDKLLHEPLGNHLLVLPGIFSQKLTAPFLSSS
ncbi:MAG: hypothetical protein K9N06_13140 [Candidatus Cloacimonetes bacterium]|nr:hypothetical protein [Candidatus Cloacimonadota bacterium]